MVWLGAPTSRLISQNQYSGVPEAFMRKKPEGAISFMSRLYGKRTSMLARDATNVETTLLLQNRIVVDSKIGSPGAGSGSGTAHAMRAGVTRTIQTLFQTYTYG